MHGQGVKHTFLLTPRCTRASPMRAVGVGGDAQAA